MPSSTAGGASGYCSRRSAIDDLTTQALEAPVRSVLGDPAARVDGWQCEPVAYDFLNPSSGGVYRCSGTASGRDWRLVLKVTRPPAGVRPELAAALADALRWDRELLAYESGFLAGLEGGFVAAVCHGTERRAAGTGWVWLEDLGGDPGPPWSLADWELVGRELGRFNGRFAGSLAPEPDWLGRGWLRVWVTHVTTYSAWDETRRATAHPLRKRLLALWAERETLLGAVEALPRTCSHLDAHRRNLFLRDGRVVAIDWGLVGLAPPGEEVASTLVGTVASGEFPAEDAAVLGSVLYREYVRGLRDAGWEGDERDVRLAFTAAAGLRTWSILGLDVPDPAVRERGTVLGRYLLELGEEALGLLR